MDELTRMVREAADRQQITDVLTHYSYCCDTRQVPRVRDEVFAADARGEYGFQELVGAAAITEWMQWTMQFFAGTMHALTNVRITLDGDLAQSTCYVTAWHWLAADDAVDDPGRPADFVFAGVYADAWRREPRGWRITRRRFAKHGPTPLALGAIPAFFQREPADT
jgi:hypothetical protein